MKSRVFGVALAGLLAIGLAGCSAPATKASPSPTPPFASADAAYKAAEATYRGYVDALNQVDLDDPKTFEPVYGWLLDGALDAERTELTSMSAQDLNVSGSSHVTELTPAGGGKPMWGDLRLYGCLNVHSVRVTDSAGNSLVQKDRPDVQSLTISFSRDSGSPTGLKITKRAGRQDGPECAG